MGHLPDGAHTHGHGGGGLGGPLAAGAGVVLAAAALPALLALLHALIIALAVTVTAALATGAAVLIWQLRRGPALPPWQPGILQPPQRPALAPREVHLHLHGAGADDVAQALAQLPRSRSQDGSPHT